MMKNTYPKIEKLKSRTMIDILFKEGKSVSKYPIRLVYTPIVFENEKVLNNQTDSLIKIGVSVSKKHFKKAVDRNYYKRLLRESYRLNKQMLIENLQQPHAFMLLYQTKEKLSFQEVQEKTIALFEKFQLATKTSK